MYVFSLIYAPLGCGESFLYGMKNLMFLLLLYIEQLQDKTIECNISMELFADNEQNYIIT